MARVIDPRMVGAPVTTRTYARGESPAYSAYRILHAGYAILPIVAGADKFFNYLTNWERYLAPEIPRLLSVDAATFMMGVGAVEILAGLIVALAPRFGGYLVALWMVGIIVNLLMVPGYYDVALRDFGLALGALALANLSRHFTSPRTALG